MSGLLKKIKPVHLSPDIKHGRTDSQTAVGLKYSRFSSAGEARASVVPADPGFCVSAELGLLRSCSTASPQVSRPLRAPSPPWFLYFSLSSSRLSACLRSRCLLYPQKVHRRPRLFAISPRLALPLSDLHLQPNRAQP